MPNNFLSSYGCQPVSLSCQTYQFSWQYKNKSSYNCSWKWVMFYFHVKWFLASTSTAVFFQVNSVAHSYQPFTFKFVQPLELNKWKTILCQNRIHFTKSFKWHKENRNTQMNQWNGTFIHCWHTQHVRSVKIHSSVQLFSRAVYRLKYLASLLLSVCWHEQETLLLTK